MAEPSLGEKLRQRQIESEVWREQGGQRSISVLLRGVAALALVVILAALAVGLIGWFLVSSAGMLLTAAGAIGVVVIAGLAWAKMRGR